GEMNAEPIPARFGAPLRLIVPGWYGMASVKWLARIEAVERPFEGEFQTEKYVYAPGDPVTRVRVKSMFTGLEERVRAGARILLSGLAWSGDGIDGVDVEIDGQRHAAGEGARSRSRRERCASPLHTRPRTIPRRCPRNRRARAGCGSKEASGRAGYGGGRRGARRWPESSRRPRGSACRRRHGPRAPIPLPQEGAFPATGQRRPPRTNSRRPPAGLARGSRATQRRSRSAERRFRLAHASASRPRSR